MPAIAFLIRAFAWAAAALFAFFVTANGIPTLRHDWTWPIDRTAIASFMSDSINGWLSNSIGMPNAHPTTYLIALPIGAAMVIFGTLAALALFAAAIGYVCARGAAQVSSHYGGGWAVGVGIGLVALFNPWVYNEIVAGHLVMVLAYGGILGLFAEMLRGRQASTVRLGLWIALIEAQLQFFIAAMIALIVFAVVTRKWKPPFIGLLVASPSVVGLVAEWTSLVRVPYGLTWQTNQSVAPLPLLSFGGYFAGYSDRLGIAAAVAVWVVLALAVAGAIVGRRSIAVVTAAVAAIGLYVVVLGLHGPFALPYVWIVRNVPESGVFRELYDLTGIFAALVAQLASVAANRARPLAYVSLAAGMALLGSWAAHPPADFWIGSSSYPHAEITARPFERVALLPAFQPLSLRAGGGDGADPDAFVRSNGVAVLNAYLPAFPVDMALARYEQSGDSGALRALGVTQIISRPWLVSRNHGAIGLAATSLEPRGARDTLERPSIAIARAMPLVSTCKSMRVAGAIQPLDACGIFFGDAPGYAAVRTVAVTTDSIDPQSAWIDARLTFAQAPALAQELGGAFTMSMQPLPIEPDSWLFAYVRGSLIGSDGRTLVKDRGAFAWTRIPRAVGFVRCLGTCELVAQTAQLPALPANAPPQHVRALAFRRLTPWMYVVDASGNATSGALLRFNERYDSAWAGFSSWRSLRHVRVDLALNGWFLDQAHRHIVLLEWVALLQSIAEIVGVVCVLWLLKALAVGPTKRLRPR